MILGRNCTRNCRFCCVGKDAPSAPDAMEPFHIAQAVSALGLRYVVITSVTRDDLADGGASHFADVICAIRAESPATAIEVLIPDFLGDEDALNQVIYAQPDVIGHNIETVRRLYAQVRPEAEYRRSLELLDRVKTALPRMLTKSGIMLGLGETKEEVLETFADLRRSDCDLLTIGQYLAPSRAHLPVAEYVPPERFEWYKERALEAGFAYVASGPLVRSSYQAEQGWDRANRRWTSGYGES